MSKLGPVESTVFEVPSGALRPERARTYEAGFRHTGPSWNGAFTGFYTRMQDQIDRVPALYNGLPVAENRAVYQKQNVGQSEIYGWEFQGEWKLLRSVTATAHATYTYGHNLTRLEPMRRIPPLFGAAAITWRPREQFWLRVEGQFAEAQDRLARGDASDARIAVRLVDGRMPGWRVYNLYAGYTHRSVSVQIVAMNIFDASYRVYGSGVDGVGRSLRAAATYTLKR
jgi:outer membrane receptor protein involved in Fe transport